MTVVNEFAEIDIYKSCISEKQIAWTGADKIFPPIFPYRKS